MTREKNMSEREERYKAVIGPKNQEYYLRHFERFDAAGKAGATWNWSAALFAFSGSSTGACGSLRWVTSLPPTS